MALITVNELNEYANDYASALADTKVILIDAAEAEVVKYLGYNPNEADRVDRFTGWGNGEQVLAIPGASAVDSLKIGSETLAATAYELDTDLNTVRLVDRVFTRDITCVVEYTAGWTVIPGEIKLATLRIASLLLTETQGNIGVTSKSFADMSRQFVNTTNFSKYLAPLSHLRKGAL